MEIPIPDVTMGHWPDPSTFSCGSTESQESLMDEFETILADENGWVLLDIA